ncbi:RluA family pseudouridine synthase [Virgibacillus alimentarius]|uniref:RluA family pseudouridine synthase n=1 Tax=Virgibacillus alimentarius TaxID=698769 RepID=UPI0004932162|nr:RluA family pseudouridine synthase [Virgibacillus alimentarius]
MTQQNYKVLPEQHHMRIDKLLAVINPEYSRSQIQSWISQKFVTVNEKVVKPNYKCAEGDKLKWKVPEKESFSVEGEDISLSILFEDEDLLVVNKPAGMVVHPSLGHQRGTLVNALLFHCDHLSELNGIERAGIVHRIDKDTSGLLIVAKNEATHIHLAEQLVAKKVERIYEAIVHGVIDHENGLVDAPIGRDPKDRQKMGIVDQGKPAITHFHVLKRFKNFTHIKCQLETGRTHQIRVHMKYIGHPLAGDPKYGPRKTFDIGGQALHARSIGFTHPTTKEWMHFKAEAPSKFKELLTQLEKMY